MKKKASRERRFFLIKNFILMFVLLAAIIMAISAWFTEKQTAEASGISIETRSGAGIDIAPAIKTYNADGTVKTDGPGEFGTSLTIENAYTLTKDCTGNGLTLIVPEFNVTKDFEEVRKTTGKEVNENHAATNALSNLDADAALRENPDNDAPEYQYIQVEFYVRSENQELSIDPNAQLLSVTEVDHKSLSAAPEATKKSDYGDFNVDGLVGAMRVALIGQPCTGVSQHWQEVEGVNRVVTEGANAPTADRGAAEKQLLWLPRPDVHLNISNEQDNVSDWSLATGVTAGQYNGETYQVSYYEANGEDGVKLTTLDAEGMTSQKAYVSSGSVNSIPSLGKSVNVTDFSVQRRTVDIVKDNTDTSNTAQYYLTKYTLKIWIEGTDSEARRAMDGGQFKLLIGFI